MKSLDCLSCCWKLLVLLRCYFKRFWLLYCHLCRRRQHRIAYLQVRILVDPWADDVVDVIVMEHSVLYHIYIRAVMVML